MKVLKNILPNITGEKLPAELSQTTFSFLRTLCRTVMWCLDIDDIEHLV